jgi:hypothetical protein
MTNVVPLRLRPLYVSCQSCGRAFVTHMPPIRVPGERPYHWCDPCCVEYAAYDCCTVEFLTAWGVFERLERGASS